jgi:GTP-binding protein EngB required for normal cell division
MGRAKVTVPTEDVVRTQAEALDDALSAGGDQLDAATVASARQIIAKVGERSALAGDHTVIALAGATGSGKSSLFNALAGRELAEIGARRPTTSIPAAAVWGADSAGELLDWLGVPRRHGVSPGEAVDETAGTVDGTVEDSVEDSVDGTAGPEGEAASSDPTTTALGSEVSDGEPVGSLEGLVLLDLPDFDSRETAHRAEAERVLALCDVFVWVTDPQKYADALLHDEYVQQLAGHSAVMLVVLNQVDRLVSEGAVEACRDDLVRLLKADGVEGVQVLTTSVATGRGISTLRQRLANAVAGHEAARQRLSADLTAVAGRLRRGVAEREASLDTAADDRLVDALSRASGVPVVLNAVDEDYRREALGRTGWIFTRWGRKLRPDPLRRLRLDRVPSQVLEHVDPLDVREIVGRSSIPAPSASARSAVKLAALSLTERAADGLPVLWAEAVTDAAAPTDDRLYERLDRIVVTTPLRANPPMWWQLMGWLQWVLGLFAVVGLAWLVVLGVVSWLQLPPIDTPKVGPFPLPTLLLLAGVLLGLLSAWVARILGRVGARHRRAVVGKRLRSAIADVATDQLVEPVRSVLDRHRETRERLDAARRA